MSVISLIGILLSPKQFVPIRVIGSNNTANYGLFTYFCMRHSLYRLIGKFIVITGVGLCCIISDECFIEDIFLYSVSTLVTNGYCLLYNTFCLHILRLFNVSFTLIGFTLMLLLEHVFLESDYLFILLCLLLFLNFIVTFFISFFYGVLHTI